MSDENITPEADPKEYRTAARDDKGHSVRGFFNMQPSLYEQTKIIVNSKRFPFRSMGDLFRYAVTKETQRLLAKQPGIRSLQGQIDIMNELMYDDECHKDFASFIDRLAKRVADYQIEGAGGEAKRLVIECLRYIKQMPDGYWKTKYTATVKERFKEYLKGKDAVNLLDDGKE